MRNRMIPLVMIIFLVFFACGKKSAKNLTESTNTTITDPILGTWIRTGPAGSASFTFKDDGLVEGDLGKDGTIDVVASYQIFGDTIVFNDKEGMACPDMGKYKMFQTKYYTSFDLINDDCGGRIKATLGFWARPDFEESLAVLTEKIKESGLMEDHLIRARINLAVGRTADAKTDLDIYIEKDSLDPRVFLNRAATLIPFDMEGIVSDCNKAIALDATNKNAYFMRGLASYELGDKEGACADFKRAIDLGFNILRIAEQEKCADFWEIK